MGYSLQLYQTNKTDGGKCGIRYVQWVQKLLAHIYIISLFFSIAYELH